MTDHGRKFRDGKSHPLPVWSGILEHRRRLGLAIYEFIWCIDKVTQEGPAGDDGKSDGLVLGGACVKIKNIARDLEEDYRTARRNMDLLESENYISRRRTAYGFSIRVHNSKKFKIWGSRLDKSVHSGDQESGQKCPVSRVESGQKCPLRVDKSVRNKEDHAVDHAVKATQQKRAALPRSDLPDTTKKTAATQFWASIDINPAVLPGAFRKTCEELLPTKNGQPLSGFMGVCMDAWEVAGNKSQPPAFARAKARITAEEKERVGRLPELEAIPWQR